MQFCSFLFGNLSLRNCPGRRGGGREREREEKEENLRYMLFCLGCTHARLPPPPPLRCRKKVAYLADSGGLLELHKGGQNCTYLLGELLLCSRGCCCRYCKSIYSSKSISSYKHHLSHLLLKSLPYVADSGKKYKSRSMKLEDFRRRRRIRGSQKPSLVCRYTDVLLTTDDRMSSSRNRHLAFRKKYTASPSDSFLLHGERNPRHLCNVFKRA